MRESYIEGQLRKQIEKKGGRFYKWVSPGNAGVPDRIAVLPGGRIWFIELKTEKGRLKPVQKWMQGRLKELGCNVRTVYGMDDVRDLMKEVMRDEVHTARIPGKGD